MQAAAAVTRVYARGALDHDVGVCLQTVDIDRLLMSPDLLWDLERKHMRRTMPTRQLANLRSKREKTGKFSDAAVARWRREKGEHVGHEGGGSQGGHAGAHGQGAPSRLPSYEVYDDTHEVMSEAEQYRGVKGKGGKKAKKAAAASYSDPVVRRKVRHGDAPRSMRSPYS